MRLNEDDFEKEFEQALASYTGPGDAGLSSRVLAAVEKRQHRWRWLLGWSVAVPAIACLAVAFLLLPMKHPHEIAPISRNVEASKSPSSVLPEQPHAAVVNDQKTRTENAVENREFRTLRERDFNPASGPRKIKRFGSGFLMATTQCPYSERPCRKTSPKLPKLDQFPTQRPLTNQEKLLIAFVTQIPESEQKAILEKQRQADGPLHIAALSIQPIDINRQP
jgi:hypothetical protein